ncbi:MAG: hypothetical protein ACTHN8_15185 [Angustibacter sp.]
MLLSGFVLTLTATTAIVGVAAAAPSPTPAPAADGTRLEAVVLDQSPTPTPTLPAASRADQGLLPTKPLQPLTRPTAVPRPASTAKRPAAVKRAVAKRSPSKRPARVQRVRPSTSLSQAVSRIPGYGAHRPTRWVLTGKYGHWGATDLGSGTVYISPSVPASRLDSVVRHEWAHVLQIRVYGSASATVAGLNAYFGGSGMTGVERAADCMALQLGATWTNYTSCSSATWQRGAAHLLAGRRP